MSECGFRAGKFPWVRRLAQRKFNSSIVNVVPMTNEDERAPSIARPNVGMWFDKLRRAGHVVLVRQYRLGGRPNAGYRINVDGQTMTIWELWAWFRSELVDGGTAAYHPECWATLRMPAARAGARESCADFRAGVCDAVAQIIVLLSHSSSFRTGVFLG